MTKGSASVLVLAIALAIVLWAYSEREIHATVEVLEEELTITYD